MQSSTSTSPLLNHAIKTRAKNVELRKKIVQLQTDIQTIEKDISSLTNTYDELVQQCQILRDKQTEQNQELISEEYQNQFKNYIHDIENYIDNKQWINTSIEKTTILSSKPSSSSIESDKRIEELPVIHHTINDELNQQLASVENWLMESAVTDIDKQSPLIPQNRPPDDSPDDLYKDLIFPTLSDDLPTQTEDIQFDENNHQLEFIKTTSPETPKQQQQQRPDKNQRRFALMRQLAEKSNKTVTKKII